MGQEQHERALIDQLIAESRLYKTGKDYLELLDFVSRMKNFAPFNAMLLQIQKPGLRFAASAADWKEKFNRNIKPKARPLIILWPFGPIHLVYDLVDTEGDELPVDVLAFRAEGGFYPGKLELFIPLLAKKRIEWNWMDAGDASAGQISLLRRGSDPKHPNKMISEYRIDINNNHPTNVQFCTLCHELGHLFLGHLGKDQLSSVERSSLSPEQEELEAESVAYLVCKRYGITPRSQTYLSDFVHSEDAVNGIDMYQIMRAAGQVESILNLNHQTFTLRAPHSKTQLELVF